MSCWIKTEKKLPKDGEWVLAKWGRETIAVKFIKGISKEDRAKMESGEIENPEITQTCPFCGATTTNKRSELLCAGDEGAENLHSENKMPYCWKSRKHHFNINGQEISEWMKLTEPYRSTLL